MTQADLARQVINLSRLLQLEQEIRQAADREALAFIAANDTHRVVPYDHAAVWCARAERILTVSGALKVERTAPQIVWLGALANAMTSGPHARETKPLDRSMLTARLAAEFERWVPANLYWVPFLGPGGRLEGGLLIMRKAAMGEVELRLLTRLGTAYGQALTALTAPHRAPSRTRRRAVTITVLAATVIVAFVPVPMSVLADARVVPIAPVPVAAPIDGVIEALTVNPDQYVTAGTTLVRFDPTEFRAAQDLALKRVAVLAADQLRTEQKGFLDDRARAEIGIARARLAEGEAELAFATDRLARIAVDAPADGVVLIENPHAWIGRPVRIGERIMAIADPNRVRLEAHVAVEDALVVVPGAAVSLFLASEPSRPVPAKITRMSYDARLLPNQTLAFIAEANFEAGMPAPRLGLTGTAKIYGEYRPLYYVLLRKPLAALRRLTGF